MEQGAFIGAIGCAVACLLSWYIAYKQGVFKRTKLKAHFLDISGAHIPLQGKKKPFCLVFGMPRIVGLKRFGFGVAIILEVPKNSKAIKNVSVQVISSRRQMPDDIFTAPRWTEKLPHGAEVSVTEVGSIWSTDYSIPIIRPGDPMPLLFTVVYTPADLEPLLLEKTPKSLKRVDGKVKGSAVDEIAIHIRAENLQPMKLLAKLGVQWSDNEDDLMTNFGETLYKIPSPPRKLTDPFRIGNSDIVIDPLFIYANPPLGRPSRVFYLSQILRDSINNNDIVVDALTRSYVGANIVDTRSWDKTEAVS